MTSDIYRVTMRKPRASKPKARAPKRPRIRPCPPGRDSMFWREDEEAAAARLKRKKGGDAHDSTRTVASRRVTRGGRDMPLARLKRLVAQWREQATWLCGTERYDTIATLNALSMSAQSEFPFAKSASLTTPPIHTEGTLNQ